MEEGRAIGRGNEFVGSGIEEREWEEEKRNEIATREIKRGNGRRKRDRPPDGERGVGNDIDEKK